MHPIDSVPHFLRELYTPVFQYSDHFVTIMAVIIIRLQSINVTKDRLLKPWGQHLSSKEDLDAAIRDSASHSNKNEDDFI